MNIEQLIEHRKNVREASHARTLAERNALSEQIDRNEHLLRRAPERSDADKLKAENAAMRAKRAEILHDPEVEDLDRRITLARRLARREASAQTAETLRKQCDGMSNDELEEHERAQRASARACIATADAMAGELNRRRLATAAQGAVAGMSAVQRAEQRAALDAADAAEAAAAAKSAN